ncbi:MAG: cell division protein FtsL [Chitinispirillaceae bacterium]|nr:cell division protein FtsL [Chitinispirillaceae bacterium]
MPKKRTPIVIKFSFILKMAGMIAIFVSLPLSIVYKEQYITKKSLQISKQYDSLTIETKNIEKLRLVCERLASKERIERIAKKSLGLEYPSTEQIVIVKIPAEKEEGSKEGNWRWRNELVFFLKRSILKDRG